MTRSSVWLVLLAAACSPGFKPQDYVTPESLMEESERLFRRGKWADAALGFRQLTFQLPGRDSLALRARFMLAESHFGQGDYLEAARQFRRVVDEAPADPMAPNALLRAGDAQAQLWKRPELDPTYGDAALATFRELVSRYPGTPAAARAGPRILALSAMYAEKEYKSGEFYRRLGAYDSAILYYKNVVASYAESPFAAPSLLRLVEIYETLAYEEERGEICDHLRSFYPDAAGVGDRCPAPTVP